VPGDLVRLAGARGNNEVRIIATVTSNIAATVTVPWTTNGVNCTVTFEKGIRLRSAQAYAGSANPGETLTVTVTLELPQDLPLDHGLFVHLDDINQQTVAQASVSLPPPNTWPPKLASGEPGTTFDLVIALPQAVERERLTYRIGVTDGTVRNLRIVQGTADQIGQPEVVAGELVIHGERGPSPSSQPSAQFADGLELLSFEPLQADVRERRLRLETVWSKRVHGSQDYKQFYHVLDENGRIVAQRDQLHRQGRYPTSVWALDEAVPEVVTVALPANLRAGSYTIFAGLYEPQTGRRLPIRSSSLPSRGDGVILGVISWP
jgi:hypothetical protein